MKLINALSPPWVLRILLIIGYINPTLNASIIPVTIASAIRKKKNNLYCPIKNHTVLSLL